MFQKQTKTNKKHQHPNPYLCIAMLTNIILHQNKSSYIQIYILVSDSRTCVDNNFKRITTYNLLLQIFIQISYALDYFFLLTSSFVLDQTKKIIITICVPVHSAQLKRQFRFIQFKCHEISILENVFFVSYTSRH